MFRWKAYGEYVTAGKLAGLQYFEEYFDLAEGDRSLARVIIQRNLIGDRLRSKKDNYKRWHTCQLSEEFEVVSETEEAMDVELEELLTEAAELGCIPSAYESYTEDSVRKRQLKSAITRAKARREKAEKKEKEGK